MCRQNSIHLLKILLSAALVFTKGYAAYLIWQIFTLDALLEATPKGFVHPRRIELRIFCLLSVNYYTVVKYLHIMPTFDTSM